MENENTTADNRIKLDPSITDPVERVALVKKIIDSLPPDKELSSNALTTLTNYILFAQTKKEKKEKKILTDNKMVTVNKREISYEGLVDKFENGEDGIYGLIANDKNIIFSPKVCITENDIETIPGLKELRKAINQVEYELNNSKSNTIKSKLLKALIEMRKDQYTLKNIFKRPIYFINVRRSFNKIDLQENIIIKDGSFEIEGIISLLKPEHISLLLCNYSKLKADTWGKLDNDSYYLLMDLENLVDKTLKEKYPMYFDILVYKIDKKTNEEIQSLLFKDYGIKHSVEYISSLWRKKIPKLIADQAQKDYLVWYYTEKEKGKWKKCSRCGQIKLVHNMFFSKNSTSRDHFYSICKDCRNKKT